MDSPAGTQATATAAASAGSGDWSAQWVNQLRQEEDQQPDKRFSWEQVSRLLSILRGKFASYAGRNATKPRYRAYTTASGKSRVRVYYLAANDCLGQTIWCADVDPSATEQQLDSELPSSEVFQRRLVDLSTLKYHLLSGAGASSGEGGAGSNTGRTLSRDEELLQERKRSYSTGITDYDLDPASGTIVFAYQSYICHLVDNWMLPGAGAGSQDAECPQPAGIEVPHTALNLAICPANPRIVAYASQRTVYCISLDSSETVMAYTLPVNASTAGLSAGLPPFAVQEEFDRFLGFWWRPASADSSSSELHLVVELVDESNVQSINIVDPLRGGLDTDQFSYPRAGTANAISSLAFVSVKLPTLSDADSRITCTASELEGELSCLELDSNSREYLVRVDWSPKGELLIAQWMNRAQDRLRLLAWLPRFNSTVCLMEETAPPGSWIEVHDLLKVLTVSLDDEFQATLLWGSEESGYRHLYHVTAKWKISDRVATCTRRQLTSGDWQVQPEHLSVDQANRLAYFNSTIVDVRAVQLCRIRYSESSTTNAELEVLTESQMFDGARLPEQMPKTCSGVAFPPESAAGATADYLALLTVHCSSHSPVARLCRIGGPKSTPLVTPLMDLTTPIKCDGFFLEPEYFQFAGPGGQVLYGLLFKPINYQVGKQYPTVQYVYGGPHVQLVTNSFVGYSFHRVTKACYFGYCVLIVDNRGSDNRGRQFASQIRHRLGALELPDQVAGLQYAAQQFGCIDLNRVGLFGWSYGGYLTLMGMRDYNQVYRLGVAGAPVTEWELYDTAYTERYMGQPDGAGGRYEASSVLSSSAIVNFPSEANRLMIVHGSIDENVHFYHTAKLLNQLAGARKPYNLLIYPSERHGLRNSASKDHFEISLMHYLCQNL